jgi:hypothetical protein
MLFVILLAFALDGTAHTDGISEDVLMSAIPLVQIGSIEAIDQDSLNTYI